jgi:hypothetical protein
MDYICSFFLYLFTKKEYKNIDLYQSSHMIITYDKQIKKFHIRTQIQENADILMKSISNCILKNTTNNSTADIILDPDYMGISFYANTVVIEPNNNQNNEPTTNPLSYNNAIYMLFYLGQQQNYLETQGYGFYQLSNTMKDIIVINNCIYLYTNQSHIKKLDKSGQFYFDYPFDKSICSPELMKICTLPATISHTTFYYSLGTIISQLLGPTQRIINTKLYWCIKRCLDDRILLFI